MNELTHIGFGTSVAIGLLGYIVVFLGLILLMLVVMLLGVVIRRIAESKQKKESAAETVMMTPKEQARECSTEQIEKPTLPDSDEPELFDTDPRDAAMVMAIVAYQLGKSLDELHFKSIREIR